MNIKVGDKVRIKTEEELLAEGYETIDEDLVSTKTGRYFTKEMGVFCGEIVTISQVWAELTPTDFNIKDDDGLWIYDESMVVDACTPIPQTLDEYICSLPLEERARWFVFPFSTDNHTEYRSILGRAHRTFNEALQATIEALKQPKEN